ncbi:hypothetical protein [Nocardia cyriacigeorgica]|uniref:hypothetical protein n=1 Tax=Nocardia cyriacigeorgica TaxID=135487 RepID=UPI002455D04B|nr:hypothetical protein [Nocardia cyriacigeorgica]
MAFKVTFKSTNPNLLTEKTEYEHGEISVDALGHLLISDGEGILAAYPPQRWLYVEQV